MKGINMRKFLKSIFWFMTVIAYRIKVTGKENIPQEGATLICPNHVHALDSVLVVTHNKRKINVLAKEELFKNGFMRFLAKVFGVYPIKQNSADLGAIKISLKLLKKRGITFNFPRRYKKWFSKRNTCEKWCNNNGNKGRCTNNTSWYKWKL